MEYGRPGAVGRLSAGEWTAIECASGAPPSDFKDLISTFGEGRFGDLRLFHPLTSDPSFNLPKGCEEVRRFLTSQQSPAIDGILKECPLILGYLGARSYLLHGSAGWTLLNFEMEEVVELGSDLAAILQSAYEELSVESPWTNLARSIWKASIKGNRDGFFTPAT